LFGRRSPGTLDLDLLAREKFVDEVLVFTRHRSHLKSAGHDLAASHVELLGE
jgi:hypothetical protein